MGDRRTHIDHAQGVFYKAEATRNLWASMYQAEHDNVQGVGFNASGSSEIYQDNASVTPNSVQVLLLIKY